MLRNDNFGGHVVIWYALIGTLALPPSAPAQVVISEFAAATSEREVIYPVDGSAPRVGPYVPWFDPAFVADAGWAEGASPFGTGYAEVATGIPAEINARAQALYLRKSFAATADDAASAAALRLVCEYDAGFIAFLNGREVARRNMGSPGYHAAREQEAFNAYVSAAEEVIDLGAASELLVEGANTLAIQLHNDAVGGPMKMAARLEIEGAAAPLVAPGESWRYFHGLVEPSGGVFDRSFLAAPAAQVEWGKVGFDDAAWLEGPGPLGFDTGTGYPLGTNLVNEVRNLYTSVYMRREFTVDAADLESAGLQLTVDYDDGFVAYLNGTEIARGTLGNPGEFIAFDRTASGGHNASMDGAAVAPEQIVTFAIDPSVLREGANVFSAQVHNSSVGSSDLILIADLELTGPNARSLVANADPFRYFIGSQEPSAPGGDAPGTPDAEFEDWIELHNAGSEPVDLNGWSLTDDAGEPRKWLLPDRMLAAGARMLVLASGLDIHDPAPGGYPHANFQLSAGGEYLALVDPSGSPASEFAGGYPPQSYRYTYGLDPDSGEYRYYALATPGAANAGSAALAAIAGEPVPSLPSGFYDEPVMLELAAAEGTEIRYTLDGSEPTEANGIGYAGPIDVAPAPPGGRILREVWTGIGGGAVSSIPVAQPPDLVDALPSFEAPSGWADSYGTRLSGFIIPPADGDYTFWIATDDGGELWLSTGDDPANKALVAYTTSWTSARQWDKYPTQQSAAIPLLAGQRYYVEALQKEGAGGDNIAVAWAGPGISQQVIPGDYLEPADPSAPDLKLPSGAVVRARAFAPGMAPSPVVTRSFLFNHDARLKTLPSILISGEPQRDIYAPNGVLTIQGGLWNADNGSQWEPVDPLTDYNMAREQGHGDVFERPIHLEVLEKGGGPGFATGAGLRIAGSQHARPRFTLQDMENSMWTGSWPNKPSFTFFFRSEYGDDPLRYPLIPGNPYDDFAKLRLRAGKNDPTNPFIKDELMRRLFINTGQVGAKGINVNVYVNAQVKGYYNLTERLREEFFQSRFDTSSKWDVYQTNRVRDGDRAYYDEAMVYFRAADTSDLQAYLDGADYVDYENYVDYILVNAYGATGDWPHNNYVIARAQEDGDLGRWRFFMWDAEGAFGAFGHDLNWDTFASDLLNGAQASDGHMTRLIYKACLASPEFRLLFADRIEKHFFHGGALTQENIEAEYLALRDDMNPSMGAFRNSAVNESFFNNWWPARRDILFAQFATHGLVSTIATPALSQHGGEVPFAFPLEISQAGAGEIYYTLDGSDPREVGGAVAAGSMAYTHPVALVTAGTVKARVLENGEWSALAEAAFTTEAPPRIAITEINYNPPSDGDLEEFVEITNFDIKPIPLAGIHFSEGIEFAFAGGEIRQGQSMLLVRDPAAFAAAYPFAPPPDGQFSGALNNAGERLTLADAAGGVIFSVVFGDADPWPESPDGGGRTLVLAEAAGDPGDAASWAQSAWPGGSPGMLEAPPAPGVVLINEVLASPGDGQAGFVELFNPGPDTVEVGNWIVAPSFASRTQGFAIPTGVPIEAGGYLSIAQEHLPFALSPAGGTVVVLATNEFGGPLGTFHEFAYGAAEPGVSYGTYAAGGEEFVVPLSEPTPGAANALPLVAEIAINEIMYQPAPGGGDEYVEIVNASAETQPLAGWRLSGAGFDFPADASLFPGQLALVVPVDPSAFRAANAIPDAVPIFGPYLGALDNGGERLALERPVETSAGPALRPEDEVRYGDAAPWPAEADGQGASLERISPAHFAGDPASWRASNPEAEPSPGLLPHLSYAQWAAPIFADFDGLIDLPHLDPDLDGIANLGEYLLGLHPLHPDPPPAQIAADPAPVLHFTRIPNRDGEAAAESSADLIGWGSADPAEPPLNNGDGSETVIVPFPEGTAFGRLRFTSGAAVP